MGEKQISVVILMGASGVGGVERVSVVLANEFVARGVRVAFCAFRYEEENFIRKLDHRVEVVHLNDGWLTYSNLKKFRNVLLKNGVTHIINQWCVPFGVALFCRLAAIGLGVKQIAVRHGAPDVNKRVLESTGIKLIFWEMMSRINLRLVYEFCDSFVLLSKAFVDVLGKTILCRKLKKVKVVPNPVTVIPQINDKEKIILYVGRLEEYQKRFSRVLEIWRDFSKLKPEWKMEVVGDGPDLVLYEKTAKNLERICFRGVQDPIAYYAKAPILLLTSEIEGFPLVVLEAMSCSCYPVILGSFLSAYDVKDACLVITPPYDGSRFVNELVSLTDNWDRLLEKRMIAAGKAKEFSVEAIVNEWMKLLRA